MLEEIGRGIFRPEGRNTRVNTVIAGLILIKLTASNCRMKPVTCEYTPEAQKPSASDTLLKDNRKINTITTTTTTAFSSENSLSR